MQGGRKAAELVSAQAKLLERCQRFEVGGYRPKPVILGSENPEEEEGTKKASFTMQWDRRMAGAGKMNGFCCHPA